jgi:hypothetical protein
MTSPLESLITEIDNIHRAISGYAENLGTYLFNPTQPFPEFDENLLTIDQLLAQAKNAKESAVDLTAGAVSSTAYKVAGISRELGSRVMTKAMMYDLAVAEASQAIEEVRGSGGKLVSQVRSMTPDQAEGQ